MVTAREFEFAAAFLLGEGNFALTNTTVRITGTQVELWPLEKLRRLFGGRIYTSKPQRSEKTGELRAPISHWILLGPRAAGLAMALYGLMSPRRQAQIRKALEVWRAAPVAPQFRSACPQGHPYSAKNTYDYPRWIKGRLRQHRFCKACKRVEGMETRATVPQDVLRARQRLSRARKPEHYREAQRTYRRRRLVSALLEAV